MNISRARQLLEHLVSRQGEICTSKKSHGYKVEYSGSLEICLDGVFSAEFLDALATFVYHCNDITPPDSTREQIVKLQTERDAAISEVGKLSRELGYANREREKLSSELDYWKGQSDMWERNVRACEKEIRELMPNSPR